MGTRPQKHPCHVMGRERNTTSRAIQACLLFVLIEIKTVFFYCVKLKKKKGEK